MGKRIVLEVHVDLDRIPGMFDSPESAKRAVQNLLSRSIGHYNPVVDIPVAETKYVDEAVLVTEDSVSPGGQFFMNDDAVVNYYFIRSTDPVKRDLVLPPHIFHKCFRWVTEELSDQFMSVVEII